MSHRALNGVCHAWLQPGGWGLSNAGLITGRGESLLVDTLMDVRLTRDMLAGLAPVTADKPITRLVNTHGNPDHWFGNQLLADAEIITAEAAAREMRAIGPGDLLAMCAGGAFAHEVFGRFAIDEVVPTYPNRTFDGRLDLDVGGVAVRLIDVGPAHTAADVVVHVPEARTVFAGDIVFAGTTPVVWAGPVGNWLKACRLLLDLDVDTVVPGHGPVCGPPAVRAMEQYLEFVLDEAGRRFAAGMPFADAARDIDLGPFAGLGEPERLAVNVHAVYRELDPTLPPLPGPQAFARMGEELS
ncbi:MBL fold metallo-hydrolase [Kutzneria sp. CA-103260]|uniref:MBL fold metallo-hydrolase n=1 Tax=Kutzneria sp. CA-103260 TaxID=2802641 RepID=UPI001BAB1DC3|nr:MBL fold metallo-hydrolase [Kutzneria sp. CA-103260]QUQ64135.1 MBL fold metallo-hydrolase [Kutzneria sp. CA-103260]